MYLRQKMFDKLKPIFAVNLEQKVQSV